MSNLVSIAPKVEIPRFDYEACGLGHLKEEADSAAFSCRKTIGVLESHMKKLVKEDAPRIRAIREQMKYKRNPHRTKETDPPTVWALWSETMFEQSVSTLYNLLDVAEVLDKASEEVSEMTLERMMQWSAASVRKLGATGDNRLAAIEELTKLEPDQVTGKVVGKYIPIAPKQKLELLKQVDEFCEEELGFEDPEVLKRRVENRANEFAKNQNKLKPGVEDFQRAIAQVTGKEPKPISTKARVHTDKAYQELFAEAKAQAEAIRSLKSEIDERDEAIKNLRDRIHQLETQIEKLGAVAA